MSSRDAGTLPLSEAQSSLAKSVVTWDDLRWIRKEWPGPIVVKGVMVSEDAKRAVEEGAAGVIVSNHGGRQLDGVAAGAARVNGNRRRGRNRRK